ncbi:unnamed protein product [Closterium sp. Naga37s-1]|nr:unnamed protein product [Closterium sp. Naga37s-1]
MLASAESAHQSSDVFASGVDSTLERELSSAGLTGFASLLKHAGLIPELELRVRFGSALTVFAPTNVALMRADPALLAFLKLPRNAELLRDVLLYHVVARPVSAFAWEGSYETLQGAPIALHVDALAFQVGGTSVKQYRALTLSLTPLSPDEHLSGKAADSTAASAQLSAGDTGSSTVVVHTVNALLLPPSVDELLSLTAGDLSIVGGMGEGGRQLAESSGFASASASAPSASPPPPSTFMLLTDESEPHSFYATPASFSACSRAAFSSAELARATATPDDTLRGFAEARLGALSGPKSRPTRGFHARGSEGFAKWDAARAVDLL